MTIETTPEPIQPTEPVSPFRPEVAVTVHWANQKIESKARFSEDRPHPEWYAFEVDRALYQATKAVRAKLVATAYAEKPHLTEPGAVRDHTELMFGLLRLMFRNDGTFELIPPPSFAMRGAPWTAMFHPRSGATAEGDTLLAGTGNHPTVAIENLLRLTEGKDLLR